MLNIGDILDGRYRLIAMIGQGGMATVYRARDLKLERDVALKVLKAEYSSDAEFVERFKNEARSAARLSHGNIVAAYDIVNSKDMHYIVMELVEGITLRDYIARKGRLTNRETIGIALQAAEGLGEAHRNNIIHRDIKSQNIIISREGRIKIGDFGIARIADLHQSSQAVAGSAHYMAPEQAATGVADARSDIYSLGISMYEMITGRLPYQGDDVRDVMEAQIRDVMVPPNVYESGIYPALNDIIMKATRKNPDERYSSAEELIEDLRHAAAEPDGHFVRMYNSVASSELQNGINGSPDGTANAGNTDRISAAADTNGNVNVNAAAGGAGTASVSGNAGTVSNNGSTVSNNAGINGADAVSAGADSGTNDASGSANAVSGGVNAGLGDINAGLGGVSDGSIGINAVSGNASEANVNAGSSWNEGAADTVTADSSGKAVKGTEEDDDDISALVGYDDSRMRFIIAGITAVVVIIIIVIGIFVLRSGKSALDVSEANMSADSQLTTEAESDGEMNYTLSIQGEDIMPDLTGMTVDEARAKLASIRLSMDSSTTDYSEEYHKGTIMNQSPAPNEVLNSDSTVYVTVSLGKKSDYVLDNLKNMTVDEAEAAITDAGMALSDTETREFSDDVAEDLVVGFKDDGQTDDGKRRVSLVLSYGKKDNYVEMPDISYSEISDAQLVLKESGLSLGEITAVNTSDAMAGDVISQSVDADEYVKKGSSIDVEVCVGDDYSIGDGVTFSDIEELYQELDASEDAETESVLMGSGGSGSSSGSSDYYYGSIDESCVVGDQQGPGSSATINVAIRLAQRIDGSMEYSVISEAIPVAAGTKIPVSFKNIKGAHGVSEGIVEVYNADDGSIYSSYVIHFSAKK